MDEYDSRTRLSSPIFNIHTNDDSYSRLDYSCCHYHASYRYPYPGHHGYTCGLPRDLCCSSRRYSVWHCPAVWHNLHGACARQWNIKSEAHLFRATAVHSIND
jgi:hypothetical protein